VARDTRQASLLRWGLLGTGRINRMLIPPLRTSPRNRLVAVGSRDEGRAAAYAREWGIDRAHGSYEALVADPGVDAVYVSLPNHLHAEWAIRALRAGKHVLCEKPLALTVAEVDSMAAAAREAGVVLAEAFMYRHHPQTLKVKQLVDAGAIGRVRLVRGSFSYPQSRPHDVRLDPAMGGGSLWDVGCYPVSLARFVLGAEPLEVFGSWALGPTGVDETFAGQLVFPDEVLVQIDCGFCAPLRTEVEIVGAEGIIQVPSAWKPKRSCPPRVLRRDGAPTSVEVVAGESYLLEVENLADAALDGRPCRVSLADSRANTAALVALLRSAREGGPVHL
jgi:predicted dehydrogenase